MKSKFPLAIKITASINIESREYNGRWYTDVRAWKVQKESGGKSGSDVPPPAEDNFVPDNSERMTCRSNPSPLPSPWERGWPRRTR